MTEPRHVHFAAEGADLSGPTYVCAECGVEVEIQRNTPVPDAYWTQSKREGGDVDVLEAVDLRPWVDVEVAELPNSTARSSPRKVVELLHDHGWAITRSNVRGLDDATIWATSAGGRGNRRVVATFRERALDVAWFIGTHWTRAETWADFTLLVEWPEGLSPPAPAAEQAVAADAPPTLREVVDLFDRALGPGILIGGRVDREGERADFHAQHPRTERECAAHLMAFHRWSLKDARAARGRLLAEHRADHLSSSTYKRHRHVEDLVATMEREEA